MLEDMAPTTVLRPEPYDPNAQDGDGDGIVQERTAWERPAGTRLLQDGAEIVRGRTLPSRPSSLRVIGRDGKEVSYTPTWLKGRPQTPLADHGASSLREVGLLSLRQIVQTEHETRIQKEILGKRNALRVRNRKLADARVASFLSTRKDLSDSDRTKTRAAVVSAAYWGTTFFSPKGFEDLGGVLNDILTGLLDADGNDALSDLRDQYSGLGRVGVQLAMMSLAFRMKASREKMNEWTDKTVEFFERQKVAAGEVNERLQRVMRESLADVLQFFRFGREAADPMEFDADLEKANPPSLITQGEVTGPISKRNKEVADGIKAAGGSLFSLSDPEAVSRLKEGLISEFPDSPFVKQITTTEEAYTELRNKLIGDMKSVRDRLKAGDETFTSMHPAVRDLIMNSSDEELADIVEEQAAMFHKTRDPSVYVRLMPNRLDLLLADGRYRTTHEVASDASGADPRRQYETMLGIPLDVAPDLRPASGYVVHPDWMKARDAAFDERYGRPPTEFDDRMTEIGIGMVNLYGEVQLKLRPEVNGRVAVGVDDTLNTGMRPAMIDEDDSKVILKSVLTEGHTVENTNEGLALGLLKSKATGSFADLGTENQFTEESFTYKDAVNNLIDGSRPYNEALIAGSFELEDVEEAVVSYEMLSLGYIGRDPRFTIQKDQAEFDFNFEAITEFNEGLEGEYFTPEALREAGLSETEIKQFMENWERDAPLRETTTKNLYRTGRLNFIVLPPDLKSAMEGVLRLKDALRRKEALEAKGVRVVVTSRRRDLKGRDMFAATGGMSAEDVKLSNVEARLKYLREAMKKYAQPLIESGPAEENSFG